MTLPTLLDTIGAERATALKLDIEGVEPIILLQLERERLPAVLAFEFGGVHRCGERLGAWSASAVGQLRAAVRTLPGLGYRSGLAIVAAAGDEMRPLDFRELVFEPEDAWGNIVVTTKEISTAELVRRASGRLVLSGRESG